MYVPWAWLRDYAFDINYTNEFDAVTSFSFRDMITDFCMFSRLVESAEPAKLTKTMISFVNGSVII